MKHYLIRQWCKSLKHSATPPSTPFILGVWHSDLLAAFSWSRNLPLSLQISASQDGALASELAQHFSFQVHRGSSSKLFHSLRHVVRDAQNGAIPAIALDGPKGPKGIAKDGVFWLQDKLQCPVLVPHFQYGLHKNLNTWDKLVLPCPLQKIQTTWSIYSKLPSSFSQNL